MTVCKEHEQDATRILEIINSLPPLNERMPVFKRPNGCKDDYDWLVNTWMPSQPDFEKLAQLTILLRFNMVLVVSALIGEESFVKRLQSKRY